MRRGDTLFPAPDLCSTDDPANQYYSSNAGASSTSAARAATTAGNAVADIGVRRDECAIHENGGNDANDYERNGGGLV